MYLAFNQPRHHLHRPAWRIARRYLPGACSSARSTRPATCPRTRPAPMCSPMRRRFVCSASTTLTARHRGMGGRWRRREDCFSGPHPRRPPPFAQAGGSTLANTTLTGTATMAAQELSIQIVFKAPTAPIAGRAAKVVSSCPPRLRHPRHHLRRPRPHLRHPRPHLRRPHLRRPRPHLRRPQAALKCLQTATIR